MAKHFHFIVPVWGKAYTQLFTDVCLPLLMTENLQSMPTNSKDLFIITTTWQDANRIKACQAFKKLQQTMAVKFILINGLVNTNNNHKAMSRCYSLAMHENPTPSETYYVFLTPDSFWSEGTFKRLLELREQNYKIAMAVGIRTNAESMSKHILSLLKNNGRNFFNLSLNYLIKLVIDNLHPMTSALDMLSSDSKFLNQWPSNIFWVNREENQIIAHCFHMHPIMVQSPSKTIPIGTTIDGEFIKNLKYPLESFYVLQNSYFGIELTTIKRSWEQNLTQPSIKQIIKFSFLHASSFHCHFFKHRIVLSQNQKIDTDLEHLISKTTSSVINSRKNLVYFLKFHFAHFVTKTINKTLALFKKTLALFKKIFLRKMRNLASRQV